MVLYVDSNTNRLVNGALFLNPLQLVEFKRGDAALIELRYTNQTEADPSRIIKFGIKSHNDFDAVDYLVYTNIYSTLSGNQSYFLSPSFNTSALNSLLSGDMVKLTTSLEITWSDDSGLNWSSTQAVDADIYNDVIKGGETIVEPLTGFYNEIVAVLNSYTQDINLYDGAGITVNDNGTIYVDGDIITVNLSAQNGTIDNLNTTNLTANHITATSLDVLSANVSVFNISQYELSGFNIEGNLVVNGSTFSNTISGYNIIADNLSSTNATIANLNSSSQKVTSLSAYSGVINNLSGYNIIADNLSSTNATIANLNSSSQKVTSLSAYNAVFNTLSAYNGTVTNLSATNINVNRLSAINSTVTNLTATNIETTTFKSQSIYTISLSSGSLSANAIVLTTTQTPATSASVGVTGTLAYDANYLYIKTAASWRRVATNSDF